MTRLKSTEANDKIIAKENMIEFYNVENIFFPSNCLICGIKTNNRLSKSILGFFSHNKNQKKDYYFSIPICNKCRSYIRIKTGVSSKEGKKVIFFSIIGLIFSIIIGLLTFSFILSMTIFSIFFIFPYLNYRVKIKSKIQLSEFIHIQRKGNDNNTIKITIFNNSYANYIKKFNLNRQKIIEKPKNLKESDTIASESKLPDIEVEKKDIREESIEGSITVMQQTPRRTMSMEILVDFLENTREKYKKHIKVWNAVWDLMEILKNRGIINYNKSQLYKEIEILMNQLYDSGYFKKKKQSTYYFKKNYWN